MFFEIETFLTKSLYVHKYNQKYIALQNILFFGGKIR